MTPLADIHDPIKVARESLEALASMLNTAETRALVALSVAMDEEEEPRWKASKQSIPLPEGCDDDVFALECGGMLPGGELGIIDGQFVIALSSIEARIRRYRRCRMEGRQPRTL